LSTVDLRFTVRLEALSGGRLTLCLFSAEGGLQEVRCEQSTLAAVSHVIDDRLGFDDSASFAVRISSAEPASWRLTIGRTL
jgi:hypothetical protein